MNNISGSTVVVYAEKTQNIYKRYYKLDFWKELKRRWMLLGVLITVALAVLTFRYGHPGGILRTEYLIYLPLSYIYYMAGRTHAQPCRLRVYILCIAHTHCVSLAVCVITVNTLSLALDRRIVEGAILISIARPCAWLPLSLSADGVTPALAIASYAASYVFLPLTHIFLVKEMNVHFILLALLLSFSSCTRNKRQQYFIILWAVFQCGRIPIQPIRTLFINAVTVLVPFSLGTLSQKTDIDTTSTIISTLLVLYVECCKLLREAEGSLLIIDVMATLFLVISWLTTVATSSFIYEKCGILTSEETNALLLVATSKSSNVEYLSGCSAGGLSRLPAVFVSPAQALLLAAVCAPAPRGLPR